MAKMSIKYMEKIIVHNKYVKFYYNNKTYNQEKVEGKKKFTTYGKL